MSRRSPGAGRESGSAGTPPSLSRLAGRFTGWVRNALGTNRETLLGGIGVGGLLLAGLLVFAPWLLPTGLLEAVGRGLLANRGAVVLLGVVTVLYAAVTVVPTGGPDDPTEPDDEWFDRVTPTETAWARSVAGREIDVTLAAENDDRDEVVAWRRRYNRREARRQLRSAVVETLIDTRRIDRSAAERLVNTGQWTDAQRAGAFLAGVPGRGSDGVRPPQLPLGTRLRDWLSGEGFDRNVEVTVAELVALRDLRGESRRGRSATEPDSDTSSPAESAADAREVSR
ncbi:DUF7269 family protein [Salinirubrum litoreum]|uniref:Uncharacterized protein n=1 Tax=Salinirubrum litoreum TaxID=1126234 RepID=A0ABD5R8Z0_9EURY|nr:hypothetical protein [Salinirubrum litoreum]